LSVDTSITSVPPYCGPPDELEVLDELELLDEDEVAGVELELADPAVADEVVVEVELVVVPGRLA